MMGGRNQRGLGVFLVLVSAVAFSLAGTFTKLIQADTMVIACWRGLFGWLAILVFLWMRDKVPPIKAMRRLGWRGWCLASVGALASLAFIAAFKMTYVANVAIIYATAPFVAGLLEWCLLRTVMRPAVLAATGLSILGIMVMTGGYDRSGTMAGTLAGEGMAVLMTIGMALFMVLVRVFRETPVVLAGGVSGLQLFLAGWILAAPLEVSLWDLILLVSFGLAFAAATILLIEGTKRITASESGLLGAAETPFAILFAWIFLAELPPQESFLGGALVLLAVLGYALRDWWRARSSDGIRLPGN